MPQRIIPPVPGAYASWECIMDLAIAQAHKALKLNEVPVGAVVLSPIGQIIGHGFNRNAQDCDPCAHAEIVALKTAAATLGNFRLNGCTLVVSLEPCLMCAGAMVHARIAGLVYGARDLKAGAIESCHEALDLPFLNHRVWHMGRIAEERCAVILNGFFALKREGA